MNKTTFLSAALVLLLVLNGVTLYMLFAKHGRPTGNRGGNGRPDMETYISKELKFDASQDSILKQLRTLHKKELDTLWKEDRSLHQALFQSVKNGTTDSLKTDSILNHIAANKKQFEAQFLKHFTEIRAICRPEQLVLLNETLDKIMNKRMRSFGDRDKKDEGEKEKK